MTTRREFAEKVKASGRAFKQSVARKVDWDFDAYCVIIPVEDKKTWRQVYQDAYVKYNSLRESAGRKLKEAGKVYGGDPLAALGFEGVEAEKEMLIQSAKVDLAEAEKYAVNAKKYKLGYLAPVAQRSSCVLVYEDGRVEII